MKEEELKQRLNTLFGDCRSSGWVEFWPEGRFTRIYSLPGGHRYPSYRGHWEKLLQRQNAVLTHALKEGHVYIQVVSDWNPENRWPSSIWDHLSQSSYHQFREDYQIDEETEGEFSLATSGYLSRIIYYKESKWIPKSEDLLLRLVAEDQTSDVYFVGIDRNWIIAPYDGGMDVLAPDISEALIFQKFFHECLPEQSEFNVLEIVEAAHFEERPILKRILSVEPSIDLDEINDHTVKVALCGSRASDSLLKEVANLNNLKTLHLFLWDNQKLPSKLVTDQGIKELSKLQYLEDVTLSSFPKVTKQGIDSLKKSIPGCEVDIMDLRSP
ncbi:MAG: hypothetical protein O7F12_06440 [Nitrospirae bacterium]|nr:hypothetical protein [Nitrospirota bacterium]